MKQLSLNLNTPFNIETRIITKPVVKKYHYVIIDNVEFEIFDLYETLLGVKDDDVLVTNLRMGNFLKKKKVLNYLGSRRNCMGAEIGSRFNELFKIIEKIVEKLYDDE